MKYEYIDVEIKEAPLKLIELCKIKNKKSYSNIRKLAGIDEQKAEQRATQYLISEAPLALEGSGGDFTTYKVACNVRDFGVDQSQCIDLMATYWNDRCEPPWDLYDLKTKVENAYNYASSPQGIAAPEAVFLKIPDRHVTLKNNLYFEKFEDIEIDAERDFLIQDFLDHGSISLMYGDSNSGKTFFALDITHHVATGMDWYGKKVSQGLAIFAAAEAGRSFLRRVVALQTANKNVKKIPLAVIPCPMDLQYSTVDTEELIRQIKKIETSYGMPAKFLVIDTFACTFGSGDENTSKDMGKYLTNIRKIKNTFNLHVMIIHHSGKDVTKGARGHSSLRAAIDTEIKVENKTAKITKQRDGETGQVFAFKLHPIEIGTSTSGATIKSCVVIPKDLSLEKAFGKKELDPKKKNAHRLLQFLRQEIALSPDLPPSAPFLPDQPPGVNLLILKQKYLDQYYPKEKFTKQSRQSGFDRPKKHLIEAGIIEIRNDWVYLLDGSA